MEQQDENCEIEYIVEDEIINQFETEESDDNEKLLDLLKKFDLIEIHKHLIGEYN